MLRSIPKTRRASRGVLLRYVLLQVPGWVLLLLLFAALHQWLAVPLWIGVVVLLTWIVKDAALYPLVREAYRPNHESASRRMIGARGVATERLDPVGYIRIGPELWLARTGPGEEPAEPGATVTVTEIDGLTLIVASL